MIQTIYDFYDSDNIQYIAISIALVPTQAQQGVHNPGLYMAQLAVEVPFGSCQLMEAGNEAHHIGVRQGYTQATTRKHTADKTHLRKVEEKNEEKEK